MHRRLPSPISSCLGPYVLALALLAFPPCASGGEPAPFAARGGLDLAFAAARAWAGDAALVYVENDEDLGVDGTAGRWGYLFYSPSTEKARMYSVREGRIVVAENLAMKFDAPPLAREWLDSGAALAAAERDAGAAFRAEYGGGAGTMLLMRGAFHGDDPDRTTWTLVYTAPGVPSLFVVVDAADGKVRRTWRG
jgi:hypothetical protein